MVDPTTPPDKLSLKAALNLGILLVNFSSHCGERLVVEVFEAVGVPRLDAVMYHINADGQVVHSFKAETLDLAYDLIRIYAATHGFADEWQLPRKVAVTVEYEPDQNLYRKWLLNPPKRWMM